MASSPNRASNYSNVSLVPGSPRNVTTISTTTLLNALHVAYTSAQPYRLDVSASLVVNTWISASKPDAEGRSGGIVDVGLARRAWEHARRRAEDGCIVLGSLHHSTPSLLPPFVAALPFTLPPAFYASLAALRPFLHCVTPYNPSAPRYASLRTTLTLTLAGELTAASIALSNAGIDTAAGLLNVPSEPGHRAFDVFYYLLTSASTPAERDFLGLKHLSEYSLLNRSGTVDPPSYLPAVDDAASAEDFRESLRAIGIKGALQRNLLSALAGLLKLGDTLGYLVESDALEATCEDVGGLLGIDPEVLVHQTGTTDRESLIAGLYEALVDWVVARANEAIRHDLRRARPGASSAGSSADEAGVTTTMDDRDDDDDDDDDDGDTVMISIVEIPAQALGKAVALRGVFDETVGINAEIRDDGVETAPAGSSVLREMSAAVSDVEAELGIAGSSAAREREYERDRREGVLERVGRQVEPDDFLAKVLYPVPGEGVNVGRLGRFDLLGLLGSSRVWYHLALHPSDESPAGLATLASPTAAWSAGTISRQLRAWRLPEWANRRNRVLDFTADFDVEEFHRRYAPLGCTEGRDGVESWLLERGWSNGEVVIGRERVWMREVPWWEAESMLDIKTSEAASPPVAGHGPESPFAATLDNFSSFGGPEGGYSVDGRDPAASGFFDAGSQDRLLQRRQSSLTLGARSALGRRSLAPTTALSAMGGGVGDYGLGSKGDEKRGEVTYDGQEMPGYVDPETGEPAVVTEQPISKTRRIWATVVWILTFWVPSFALRVVGRMKRPDVRMAWREKLVLFLFIGLLNALVVFYIIALGKLLCPNFDKAWREKEISTHQGEADFWVSVHGKVYDISKFWKLQHSDTNIRTTRDNMQPLAGMNLDAYFAPPLTVACPGLVDDITVMLQPNKTIEFPEAMHVSGPRYQPDPKTALRDIDWYPNKFLPRIKEFYKGDVVWDPRDVQDQGENQDRQWFILHDKIFDLTDYFHTLKRQNDLAQYSFFATDVEDLVKANPGADITELWESRLNLTTNRNSLNCLNNAFYLGRTDFTKSAKCQVSNWSLLAFAIIICTVILAKFLAALQLGSKRHPAPQDKFVVCLVPAYTEGEDQLRRGLDSLTSLRYDNKRKLICVVCDGMIVGGGNDRPTPKIVLDILGVDPRVDPPALPFKSVGQGSEQLNYAKVYSGLYEYEGNVVPYVVVVKVGKESEQARPKPGNRGKRDSQVLLLNFLNRVHHRSPMSPMELEVFHQINNIIGVDPELYEYVLMVDADTSVQEESLNRLVAACANNTKVAGICGETSLENEQRSWWTMIQVYEYYISHHLAKAFESLFGSVTCLPGW